jgi:DNA uptake protein ComE-like DNA-binding protein
MRFPYICSRHKAVIFFLIGIALGFSVIFFFVKDRFAFVDDYKEKSETLSTTTNQTFRETKSKKAEKKYNFRNFNPNNVTYEDLISFGLSKKQANNILNYRNKIGTFKDKAQFAEIYCMRGELFNLVSPYLVFDSQNSNEDLAQRNEVLENQNQVSEKQNEERISPIKVSPKSKEERESLVLDLNNCDTLDLQQIKGIGKVRATRIYKYGKRLGGYVSVEQLREVYGIDDEVFEMIKPYFKVSESKIRKVNINSDDVKYLTNHPYIDFQLAKALIRFRKSYGRDFQSVEEVRGIHILSQEEFEKLLPYLKTKD